MRLAYLALIEIDVANACLVVTSGEICKTTSPRS
jgi:hypothetical protein